jgi:hypothetical protein
MSRKVAMLAAAAIAAFSPAHAAEGEILCKLCAEAREEARERAPIEVDVESGISFSRMALLSRGDGEAEIDPLSGRKLTRDNLMDLGGMSFSGRARVTGEPLQPVRVDLPGSVTLHSPGGATVELTDFETDLPDLPMLDASGNLEFTFGGRLRTIGGGTGNFRGRIPIRVDYN